MLAHLEDLETHGTSQYGSDYFDSDIEFLFDLAKSSQKMEEGDLEKFKIILGNEVNIDLAQKDGRNLLSCCVMGGQRDAVKFLLDIKFDRITAIKNFSGENHDILAILVTYHVDAAERENLMSQIEGSRNRAVTEQIARNIPVATINRANQTQLAGKSDQTHTLPH